MTTESQNLSTFVWKMTTDGLQVIGKNIDDFFRPNSVYVTWRDKVREIQIEHADKKSKIHRVIQHFGLLAPIALVGFAACKNPLMFIVAAGVAAWATQKANMFSTLKHSVIQTPEDGLTAAILIAPTQYLLKSNAFYALIGFVTGYALSHIVNGKSPDASTARASPSDQSLLSHQDNSQPNGADQSARGFAKG